MTTIVAIKHAQGVLMAADRQLTAGWSKEVADTPKLFRRAGFLFGTAGLRRSAQIIKHHFTVRRMYVGEDLMEYLTGDFVKAIDALLAEHGQADSAIDFLLAAQGRLFHVDSTSRCVLEYDFCAIGSGREYAMGALNAIPTQIDPRDRALRALEIAARYDNHTSAPFDVLESEE